MFNGHMAVSFVSENVFGGGISMTRRGFFTWRSFQDGQTTIFLSKIGVYKDILRDKVPFRRYFIGREGES